MTPGLGGPYQYAGIDPAYQYGTRVTLTLPGGTPEGFTFEPYADLTLGGGTEYHPYFYPDAGVTDQLSVPDVPLLETDQGYITPSDANMDPYNPADPVFGGNGEFTVTSLTGTTWTVNAATGMVDTETDRNGNTLTFSYTGITSSSGRSVTFVRNGAGQITQIIDPLDHAVTYGYDTNSNLTSVTDRNNDPATQFVYETTSVHLLDHIIDAFGNTAARFTYAPDGRVSGVTNAQGNTSGLGYNIGSLSGTVTAPGASSSTSMSFDSLGNVTSTTDPTGDTTQDTYAGTELASTTQTVGSQELTTSYAYDPNGDVTSVTDPLRNVNRYTFNADGEPLTTSDADGNTTSFQYDASGNLLSTTSPTGVVTSFQYDAAGNVLQTTTTAGTTTNTYDASGDLLTTTNPQGVTTTNTYDADGDLLTSSWVWIDPTNYHNTHTLLTRNTYDANGNLIETDTYDDGVLQTTTTTKYDVGGRAYSSTDEYGGVTTTVYDTDGNVIQTTTPDGMITDTVYDDQNRVLYTDDPHPLDAASDGTYTIYDADGNVTGTERLANVVIAVTLTQGTLDLGTSTLTSVGAVLSQTATTYDSAGRVASTTDASGMVTDNTYDGDGNPIETDTYVNGIERTTTSTYDDRGHVTSTTDALGHTTSYAYNTAGQVIKTTFADGSSIGDAYDSQGRKTSETDQNGNTTGYAYDQYGNLVSVTEPAVLDANPSDSTYNQTAKPTYYYTYDTYGDLIAISDANSHETRYGYDPFGHKVSETLPGGQSESWVYSALGQMTSFTDFDGDVTDYEYYGTGSSYGAPGQLETETIKNASGTTYDTITYEYNQNSGGDGSYQDIVIDSLNGTTITTSDSQGDITQIASPQGTIDYVYDPATGQKTETYTIDPSTDSVDTAIFYAYDPAGELTSVTVTRLNDVSLTTALATTYAYDLDGNLVTTQNANGTTETRTYDPLNRLTAMVDTGPSGTVASFSYVYDPAGHVLTETDLGGRTDTYTYDALGRLTQQVISDPVSGARSLTWSFDLVGNRMTSTDSGAPTDQQSLTYSYNANDELLSITGSSGWGQSYTYDANGSTLIVTGTGGAASSTSTWTPTGQMATYISGSTNVSYTYDDVGNRTSETVNGVTTTYVNDPDQAYDQVLEEYSTRGDLLETYVRGIALLFQDRSGVQSYYVTDDLGSVRALTNSASSITNMYTYDAYGDILTQTGTTVNEFLYAGMQMDSATGQYYDRARYYDASAGRFTSRDSYDGQRTDPITQNHYIYAGADPVDHIDASGYDFSLTESMAVGAGIGGFAGFFAGAAYGYYHNGTLWSLSTLKDALLGAFGGAVIGAFFGAAAYASGAGGARLSMEAIERLAISGERQFWFKWAQSQGHTLTKNATVWGFGIGVVVGFLDPDQVVTLSSAATTYFAYLNDTIVRGFMWQQPILEELLGSRAAALAYRQFLFKQVQGTTFVSIGFLYGFTMGHWAGTNLRGIVDELRS